MGRTINYDCIIWDWNGTLLDDADYCIEVANKSLEKHGLPLLDKDRYYKLFRFPVIDYYIDLGYDFAKIGFDELSVEFHSFYGENKNSVRLRKEAREVLAVFRASGIPQYILSASERKVLTDALSFYEIENYFDAISAGDDLYASGKAERGKEFIKSKGLAGKRILLVGDTEHDFDTANAIGADCVLCCGGHSSKEKLSALDAVSVIDNLHGLYPIVFAPKDTTAEVSRKKDTTAEYIPFNVYDSEKRSYDINEAEPNDFKTKYKAFYDDLKNTNKTEDW